MKNRLLRAVMKAYIPKGPYCYKTIGKFVSESGVKGIKVKLCPFYHSISVPGNVESNFCSYCGAYDDLLLDDQCKVCGERE